MRAKQSLTIQISDYPLSRVIVKKAMLDSDLRVVDLATRFGVNHSTISLTISGKTRNLAIQQAIAAALKRPLEELWDMTPRKPRKRKITARSSSAVSTAATEGGSPSLAASAQENI